VADTTQVIEAIKAGDGERLRALLQESPALAEARDENGVSALMLALYHGRSDLADVIRDGRTELDIFEAATVGDVARLRALLQQDPDLARAYSPDGFTALHFSAFFGKPETARYLLAHGADPNAVARNSMGVQPLHSAAAAGHLAAADVLLEFNADVNGRQEAGYMPLHEAVMRDDVPMVQLFLARGADPSRQLDDGRDAYALAAERGNAQVGSLLGRR
jgi:ankyrin repeat protein